MEPIIIDDVQSIGQGTSGLVLLLPHGKVNLPKGTEVNLYQVMDAEDVVCYSVDVNFPKDGVK